ncbi:MAG TPA: DUF5076 domain-containing protein [Rhizomicrobium sp.]|nr:DUF5076 domain-containing protein [Rhizomicrobium sp.]
MTAKQLPVPASADVPGSNEVLRAFIVNGGLQVALIRAFDKPDVWGVLLADIARHAARIFAREDKIAEADALEKICNMFDAEMARPTDLGTTDAQRKN